MENTQHNLKKGLLYAFAASIISGIAIFYSKISVAKIDPLVLTTSRNLLAGVILLLPILFSGKLDGLKKLNKKEALQLVLIGVIGGGIPFFLFFTGLKLVGAQTANIIHKSLFIWVLLLSLLFLRERFRFILFVSYLLVIAGTFLMMPVRFTLGKGELFILLATIMWSVENLIAKKVIKTVSSEIVGLSRMFIGVVILLFIGMMSGALHLFTKLTFPQILSILIGGTILSLYVYFWYKGLQYAPASFVTLILTFSVIVGNVLNGMFAGIKITTFDIKSSIFIVSAMVLVVLFQKKFLHER